MSRNRLLLLPVLAVSIAYLNSFPGVFQFDDYNVIVGNGTVHSWQAWVSDLGEGIRPLLKFSYMLNWTSGAGLFGFHLFNTAVHASNAIMVYFLSMRMISPVAGASDADRTALFASLLFALHPVQTEAVTYISGRSVSLMAMFYLGSILCYLRGAVYGKERAGIILSYVLSPVLFIAAILTKETAVTLPFALLLADRTFQCEKSWGAAVKRQAIHWLLFVAALFALIAHPGHGSLLEYSFDIRGMGDNVLTQINGVSYLVSRLVVLNGMNIDPDLPVINSWSPALFAEAVFLVILLASGLIALRYRLLSGFGVLWFFLQIVPTNSVVPRLDVANDRQLYLASYGIFLAIAAETGRVLHSTGKHRIRRPTVYAAAFLVLVLMASFTIARNHDYRSEIALWEDTAAGSPLKARVHNNLGYAYFLAGRIEDARKSYLVALSIKPDYTTARDNLGRLGEQAPPR